MGGLQAPGPPPFGKGHNPRESAAIRRGANPSCTPGLLWGLAGTKHSCFVPLALDRGHEKRKQTCRYRAERSTWEQWGVVPSGCWSAWLLRMAMRGRPGTHQQTQRQCGMGRERDMGDTQGLSLSEQREGHPQDHGSRDPTHGANTELLLCWACMMPVCQPVLFLRL